MATERVCLGRVLATISSVLPMAAGGCRGAERYSRFSIEPAPTEILSLPWRELLTDPSGDSEASDADGKSLAYAEDGSQVLWFKLVLHGPINLEAPAVSIAMDTDQDGSTGAGWYGANKSFKVDLMLSVGPVRREGDAFVGYNGLTDAAGISARDWINVAQGSATFFVAPAERAYFVGVPVAALGLRRGTLRVIGSVGSNARWRDDIGDSGFATIALGQLAR